MALAVVLVLFALAFVGLTLSLRALAVTGVPVRASDPEAVAAALDLLALKDGERFADLGCGTGGVLRAARRRARVRAVGWELNPFAFGLARARNLLDGGVRVRLGDFRRAPPGALEGLDAVYAYLMPRALAEVGQQLESQLRDGARFVVIDFPVPGWTPAAVREVGRLRQPVRLYVVGRHRGAAPPPAAP
jgi:SAM-dependent methyltransferase